jgi:chromosome segregation ATPase
MAISNSKKAAAPKEKAAPKADADCCVKCDAKIASLEKKVAALEASLKGVLEALNAASKVKSELDEAKAKLSAEVNELKEKAKSWKEKADTNNDGKVDFEEVYGYVRRRMASRNSAPKK